MSAPDPLMGWLSGVWSDGAQEIHNGTNPGWLLEACHGTSPDCVCASEWVFSRGSTDWLTNDGVVCLAHGYIQERVLDVSPVNNDVLMSVGYVCKTGGSVVACVKKASTWAAVVSGSAGAGTLLSAPVRDW